jgi:putative ABC transport system permease protein
MEVDKELFSIAFRNLKTQKMRSSLTLLGIVIGIAAIIALVSLGEGLNLAVTEQFEKLGMETLFVEPGSGENVMSTAVSRALRDDDIGIIEGIPGVEGAMGFYETVAIAEFRGKNTSVFIIGFDPKKVQYLEDSGYIDLVKGRMLEPNDRYAVIIPERFANEGYHEETLRVRDILEINGQKFKIVGISKDMGGTLGGLAPGNMVWFPKETVQDFFGEEDPVEIAVMATDRGVVDEVAEKITERLKRAHGEEDFYVMTTENMLEAFGAILGVIQFVLVLLAGISLFVGGIGIMNTMLMAVMERTKEIGVMKAIGATNTKVLSIFLAEAALIGGVGGAIGVAFGLLIAFGVSVIATAMGFGLPVGLNILGIIGAIAFAMGVGMVAGFIPARRAALLEPVEALRYGM